MVGKANRVCFFGKELLEKGISNIYREIFYLVLSLIFKTALLFRNEATRNKKPLSFPRK